MLVVDASLGCFVRVLLVGMLYLAVIRLHFHKVAFLLMYTLDVDHLCLFLQCYSHSMVEMYNLWLV